jgi:endoglucanase
LLISGCSSDPKATKRGDDTMLPLPGPGGQGGLPIPSGPAGGTGGSGILPTPGTSGIGGGGGSGGSAADAGSAGAAGADAAVADAGPTLPTVCADDDAGVPDPVMADEDAGPLGCIVVGDVKLQYRAADTNAGDNAVKPHFNLVNTGTKAVNLAELTIRYWFADAGTTPLMFWCDYAQIGCGSVRGVFTTSDRPGGDHVLELSFTSGTLAAGAATGEIQTRFNHEDWALFAEGDDYSFDPSKASFADWHQVTLYQRGTLIWGLEPQ